jgi:hypothetical protein
MDAEDAKVEGAPALASVPGGNGGGRRPPDPKLKRSGMTRMGQGLRTMYDPFMREPIPEHLLALLNSAGARWSGYRERIGADPGSLASCTECS